MTRTHPTLALATFAALGLVVHPAAAQNTLTLQSGDNVTVNALGTTGIYQGQPLVGDTTNTYTTTGNTIAAVEGLAGSTFALQAGGSLTGTYESGLFTNGDVTVTGGSVVGNNYGLLATGSSSNVTITGGDFSATASANSGSYGLYIGGGSTVKITGGTFQGNSYDLDAAGDVIDDTGRHNGTGVIDLFGTGFSYTVNGTSGSTPIVSGTIPNGPFAETTGTLTGTLLDGQHLSTNFAFDSGAIEINVGTAPAPEPSQTAALALGALGLAALALRARRRRA